MREKKTINELKHLKISMKKKAKIVNSKLTELSKKIPLYSWVKLHRHRYAPLNYLTPSLQIFTSD